MPNFLKFKLGYWFIFLA